jgi:hypothetical protein
MSRRIASRLETIVAAGQNIIQKLSRPSSQLLLETLYVNVLSTYSHNGGPLAATLLCTIALMKRHVTLSRLCRDTSSQLS